jgi:hypothetical protein
VAAKRSGREGEGLSKSSSEKKIMT